MHRPKPNQHFKQSHLHHTSPSVPSVDHGIDMSVVRTIGSNTMDYQNDIQLQSCESRSSPSSVLAFTKRAFEWLVTRTISSRWTQQFISATATHYFNQRCQTHCLRQRRKRKRGRRWKQMIDARIEPINNTPLAAPILRRKVPVLHNSNKLNEVLNDFSLQPNRNVQLWQTVPENTLVYSYSGHQCLWHGQPETALI